MQHGDFTHIEIPADDPVRAMRFYAALFGWTFDTAGDFPDYHLLLTPSGLGVPGGAIGRRGAVVPSGAPMPHAIRVYVEVESIDDTLGLVERLGGAVVAGRREIPGHGWGATVRDPEGNDVSLWQSAMSGADAAG